MITIQPGGETLNEAEHAFMHAGGRMHTFTGKLVDPLVLRVEDIDEHDIAHALALTNRYGGHTSIAYSVAEHSILVGYLARLKGGPVAGLLGLLHDAHEAYLGDMIHPLKHYSCSSKTYGKQCDKAQAVIDTALGVPLSGFEVERKIVRDIDRWICLDEAAVLLPHAKGIRRRFPDADIIGLSPPAAELAFLMALETYREAAREVLR
jgi:hypothetical protein